MTKSLIFLIIETRPDIVFITSIASLFAKNPGYQYTKAVKTILCYLKSSRKQDIIYGWQNKLLVEEYSNFNWVKDKKCRKSTSNFIFMPNKGLVSWYSKKESRVTFYLTEAKYIVMTLAAKEVI